MIDTHSHIYLEQFKHDIDEVISRAKQQGILKIIMPNIDCDSISDMMQLADNNKGFLFPMMGLHPTSVNDDYLDQLKCITKQLHAKKCFVAVGEIGIDLYWDDTYKKQQIEAFHMQLSLAQQLKLPVAIHMRNSFDVLKSELASYAIGSLRGVFHCFTGNMYEAKWIIDRGFFLGIGGVVTFKNSELSQSIANVPLNSLLLETDAPYLAPAPFRGKRNEPSYLVYIAKKMSEIFNKDVLEIMDVTSKNAQKLFTL